MAADPPDVAAVNSVNVRASAVQAATAHALQHDRATLGVKPSSAFLPLSKLLRTQSLVCSWCTQ